MRAKTSAHAPFVVPHPASWLQQAVKFELIIFVLIHNSLISDYTATFIRLIVWATLLTRLLIRALLKHPAFWRALDYYHDFSGCVDLVRRSSVASELCINFAGAVRYYSCRCCQILVARLRYLRAVATSTVPNAAAPHCHHEAVNLVLPVVVVAPEPPPSAETMERCNDAIELVEITNSVRGKDE